MTKVHRYVLTNVPIDKQKEVFEVLYMLIQKGIIKVSDIHMGEEEKYEV